MEAVREQLIEADQTQFAASWWSSAIAVLKLAEKESWSKDVVEHLLPFLLGPVLV